MKSITVHWQTFRVVPFSSVSDEVKEAWHVFTLCLLPKISMKWAEEIENVKNGRKVMDKSLTSATISDEAFVMHVLSLHLPHWEETLETAPNSTPGSTDENARKKKSKQGSPDEIKKLQNFTSFYTFFEDARSKECKTEWEEYVFQKIEESDDLDDSDEMEDIVHKPGSDDFCLPNEEIDETAWSDV